MEKTSPRSRVRVGAGTPFGEGPGNVMSTYDIRGLAEWILKKSPGFSNNPATRRVFTNDEIVTFLHHPVLRNDMQVQSYLYEYLWPQTTLRRQLPERLWHMPPKKRRDWERGARGRLA
eukprot:4472291-Pleurochrysis_carterae.AAC.1